MLVFLGSLSLLSTPEGGRRKPIFSGYRPAFQLGDSPEHLNDAQIVLCSIPMLWPGNECMVIIQAVVPEHWADIRSGRNLPVYEGSHLVGTMTVSNAYKEILDD